LLTPQEKLISLVLANVLRFGKQSGIYYDLFGILWYVCEILSTKRRSCQREKIPGLPSNSSAGIIPEQLQLERGSCRLGSDPCSFRFLWGKSYAEPKSSDINLARDPKITPRKYLQRGTKTERVPRAQVKMFTRRRHRS